MFFCLYFIWTRIARYLVIAFNCSFLDLTQDSHYYWHGGNFKVPYFFHFYFQVFVFTYFIIFFDMSLSVGTDISEGMFFFYSP